MSTLAVAAIGVAASLGAFFLTHDLENSRAQVAFEQLADERIDLLQERLREALGDARSIAMLFHSSVEVTRQEFRTFVLPILSDEPGIVGAFWFPRVQKADCQSFEQRARREGLGDFAVRVWGSGEPVSVAEPGFYYPLYYGCPEEVFARQLGWDLLTEPVRAGAAMRALASGQMSASAPLRLSNGEGQFGYLVLFPLVGSNRVEAVGAHASTSVIGLVGVLLDVSQLVLRSPPRAASPDVQLVLQDPGTRGGATLLWSTSLGQQGAEFAAVKPSSGAMVVRRVLSIADRRLEAVAVPSSSFEQDHRPWASWLVLSLGIVGTLVFASYGAVLRGRAVVARRHAAEMRAVLDQLNEEMRARAEAEKRLRASEKMEAIGRLAGGIAHDFNNLLQLILGNAELLQRQAKTTYRAGHGEAGVSQSEELEEIRKAAELAAGLTHKLLTFARPGSGEAQVLRLDEQVDEMMPLLERTTPDNVRITFHRWGETAIGARHPHTGLGFVWTPCPACTPSVRMDPSQLQQVVLNLVINAAEAMPGGGEITVAVSAVTVDEAQAKKKHGELAPGGYALLEVRDTGQGMGPETISRIFEPFFSTKERGHGTGLGLATVYGIVKGAGGYIEVESEVGRGSSFRVYFPLVAEEAPDKMTRSETGGAVTMESKATVLVVEDNDAVRRLAVRVLAGAGYQVREAADGAEALRLVKESLEAPDVLLTDVSMPGMSGEELAARLWELFPELRVIFASGYADDAVEDKALASRAVFLHKPFTPAALLGRLQEILEGRGS